MRRLPSPRLTDRAGMTLIEIIVVLSLLAIMMVVAVPSLKVVLGVNQRKASRTLAATMRYVFEEASVRNVAMRIAYDLDHGEYWVEESSGPARIFRNRDDKEAFTEFMTDRAMADAEARRRMGDLGKTPSVDQVMSSLLSSDEEDNPLKGEGGGMLSAMFGGALGGGGYDGGSYKVNDFTPVEDEYGVIARRTLPDDVRFWGVFTPQYDEIVKPMDEYELEAQRGVPPDEQEVRIVYTHVFPGGYMEDTVVYLSDASGEDITSLTVEPLIGRVMVEQGYVEPPDTRDRDAE